MSSQSTNSILIVDDEPLTALENLQILKKHNFNVYIVHRGEDAIEYLRKGNEIKLILMDMQLGCKENGAELAEKLLSIKHIPIIFLTYHNEASYTERAGKVFNYGYLSKDTNEDVFIETVNMALRLSEDRLEMEESERARRNSEYLLAETQKMGHIGTWTLDISNNQLYWTDEVYRIFGLKPQEFGANYEAFLEAVHPEDREKVDTTYTDSIQQDKDGYEIEHRIIRKDTGEIRYVHEKCEHIRDEQGTLIQSIGMVQDITEYRQKENALRKSEAELRHLFQTMIEGFIWTDTEGMVVMANNAAAEMFAYESPSELIGLHIKDVHEKPEKWDEYRTTLDSGKSIVNLDFKGKRRDGTLAWMLVNIQVLKTQDGEEIGMEILLRDITDRKEKEEELKLLRRAVEDTPLSIIMTDAEGTIEYVNPFFCSVTGYSKEEVLGENPRILKSGEHDDQFYGDMWNTLTKGEDWQNEICNKKKDGELYWEFSTISPVRSEEGLVTHYLAIKEDITERKELEKLKDDVEKINRHDMKSPLNGIIGIPQLLMGEPNITDSQREYLQMIIDSGHTLLNMIHLSLTVYQIEQGTYEYSQEYFDLLKVCRQCMAENQSLIDSKNIKTITSTNGFEEVRPDKITVTGEELLAYSVVSNLVKNAVEASPTRGLIKIDITNNKSDILFSLHNQGVVPKEIRDCFFNKYTTSSKKGGTGIGTYSAKILSEAQGWSIGMQTSEAKGTTITVTIPKIK